MNKPKRPLGISASSYAQLMDCHRKWYIGYIIKPDVPKTPALQMGIDIHEYLEAHLKGEELPDIGEKLVNIAKAGFEHLPAPGTVQVEEWVEDVCGPLPFRGKIDFYTYKDGVLHISDHKTTGRSSNAKTEAELSLNPQMLAYAYVLAKKIGTQPKKIKFSHIYYLTKSKIATSFTVHAEAEWSDVEKNWKDFERAAKVMSRLAKAEHQKAIMPDVSKCRFCWYKEHCEAYPKKDKKQKSKPKSGEEDMSIMDKIKEQKAKQAAARAAAAKADKELAKLQGEVKKASEELEAPSIDHPLSPKDEVDWAALSALLITAIEEREAAGETFSTETLFDFLEYQLDRDIKQEDADKLVKACGDRLVQAKSHTEWPTLRVKKANPAPKKARAKKAKAPKAPKAAPKKEATPPQRGLSDYIQTLEDAPEPSDRLPPKWTGAKVKRFWKQVLMLLSSSTTIDDETVRTLAKEATGGSRLPRASTIVLLLKYINGVGIPLVKSETDCGVSLGVSEHEEQMAKSLVLPEKEETKTHLKPVGDLKADVVVVTTAPPEPTEEVADVVVVATAPPEPTEEVPIPEETEETNGAPPPVVIYVNAFPSDHHPQNLSTILGPLQEEVAEEHGLPYYHLVKYEKGPSHVASKFLALLNGSHASEMLGKTVFATQKDPCLTELLPILERRADIIIVRGFIG